VLIAGGGTAGHLLPGLAVARELRRQGLAADAIHFAGSVNGPEADLVPDAGFDVTLLKGRGIQRRLTMANLKAIWGLLGSLGEAFRLVRRTKPSVVLVLGGFASAAVGVAAVVLRAPVVVADQNARAGAVNRLLGRFAKACAVPFSSTDLPNATVTGNPVREQVLEAGSNPQPLGSAEALGMPSDRLRLGVFTGSLGSKKVNLAVAEAVEGPWKARKDLAVHHVVGARDFDDPDIGFPPNSEGQDGVAYRVVRYEEHVETLLDAADLVVTRAGGTTVAELAVMGTPSVLVPLPIATRDHQSANAAELAGIGAAVVVPDADLDTNRLVKEVDALLGDESALAAMASAARLAARPDAAEAVVDLLARHAR
jgi:undecaprenyldiphospho-muramoylpentapeptide beta-N-acetylglucosaminyltransferase